MVNKQENAFETTLQEGSINDLVNLREYHESSHQEALTAHRAIVGANNSNKSTMWDKEAKKHMDKIRRIESEIRKRRIGE